MADTIKDLVERLEKAEEGSRELDLGIEQYLWQRRHAPKPMPKDLQITYSHYTTSIDAALSLVPENWSAWELRSRGCKTLFVAEVSRLVEREFGEEEERKLGHAAMPALALCAAALKARQ